METIKKFFIEDNGNYSLMRLMCFMCLVQGMISSYLPGATLEQTGLWLGFAFGSKLIQKPMEKGVTQ